MAWEADYGIQQSMAQYLEVLWIDPAEIPQPPHFHSVLCPIHVVVKI